ncbi:Protein RecA [anaerobic digester metagenome]
MNPESERLQTGSVDLNRLIGGGYESGVVTQLYGEAATGKSTLCVLATVQALRTGRAVVYIDTEGFSTERFRQIAGDEAESLVERLFLFEPLDLAEQATMIANADSLLRTRPAALIVLDSATALYRQEDLEDSNEAMRRLTRQMLHLLGLARRHNLPVLVTNQVYMDPGRNRVVGLGGTALEHISKVIVRLEKADGRRRAVLAKHRSRPEGAKFEFEITGTGIQGR